jgi:tetratricopeptide (TPR) repeat protein
MAGLVNASPGGIFIYSEKENDHSSADRRRRKDYMNMSGVYRSQGKYGEALEYHNKALVIDLQVHGTEHPNVGDSYYNMGGLHMKQDDYVQALDLFERALGIYLPALGADHPDTKNTIKLIDLLKEMMHQPQIGKRKKS